MGVQLQLLGSPTSLCRDVQGGTFSATRILWDRDPQTQDGHVLVLARWGLPCSQSCEPRCHPGKTRETLEPCEQAGSPGNWLGPWAGRWRAIKEKSPRRRLQRRGGSGDITAKALADPFCRKPAREIPPMAKVMRKSSVGQRRDQASREPPGPS